MIPAPAIDFELGELALLAWGAGDYSHKIKMVIITNNT